MWLRLRNVEKKKVCPFLLLENSRPLSPPGEPQTPFASLGTPDFLTTCLGIDSLTLTSIHDYWKSHSFAEEAEVERFYEDLQDLELMRESIPRQVDK